MGQSGSTWGGFPIEIESQISLLITYSLVIKIAKLYVISKLIWVTILIGNPPNFSKNSLLYKDV